MTRVTEILINVRDTLADLPAKRWTDERLLKLLSQAQRQLCVKLGALKNGTYSFAPLDGVREYSLPDDILAITRASSSLGRVSLVSFDKLDELARTQSVSKQYGGSTAGNYYQNSINGLVQTVDWENDTGSEVEALIYDQRAVNKIKVYPLPESVGGIDSFTISDYFGVVADLTDYTVALFGFTQEIIQPDAETVSVSPYGVIADIQDSDKMITVSYSFLPPRLATVADKLELPEVYDLALQYLVTALAYSDDVNTGSTEKANTFAGLASSQLEELTQLNSQNHARTTGEAALTTYNTPWS